MLAVLSSTLPESCTRPYLIILVVLEQSERLRDSDANILPVLCRLQELTQDINIIVIFLSSLPIEKFRAATGFMEPVVINFPQYTKDELVDILLKQRPSSHSVEFYKNYIKLVLSVFYLATKGLPELKHQVQLHFKAYCEPLEKGEADEHDIRLLWRNIEPQLKKSMSSVYLREVSSAQYERMQQLTETAPTDQSHFKSALTNKAKERSSSQLVGPKPFPLDRLLAIFYSIIDDKVTPTANIFSQISTLVTLRLVTQIGGNDQLDSPKYKCAVTLDFIRNVARMVSFDVVRYLYDYA
ncbi:hypothetical protein OTU49_001997 [Cherax quadricarinatus]|uniref:Origin recognition complex subunit 5 n=1 Tax=Cherax quadricarinatus TaxID=27406 RepID=A0AAW0XFT8_CHEQU